MHNVALRRFANEYDMSKNSDDSGKVSWWTNGWEIFGKFMAIVTCTGVIVTIYINLSPSGPDLVGYGWHTNLHYPPQFEAARDSIKNRTSSRYLYDFIMGRDSTISHIYRDSLRSIVSELSDSIQAVFEEDFVYYRGYVIIKIRNEGDRVASDIVLDIPRRGIALINHPDTVQYVTQVDRNVSLNNLRPGNIVEVQIWAEHHIFTADEGTLQITYDRGVGSISFSKEFSGIWRIYR